MIKSIFGKIFLLLILAIFLDSCDNDNNSGSPSPGGTGTENIWDLANQTQGLDSILKYLGQYPSLIELMVDTSNSLSVTLPTNKAFIDLLNSPEFPDNINELSSVHLEILLSNHVFEDQTIRSGMLVPASTFSNLNSIQLVVNPFPGNPAGTSGTLYLDAGLTELEIKESYVASNGFLSVVSDVVLDEGLKSLINDASSQSIWQLIQTYGRYDSAEKYLGRFPSLVDILSTPTVQTFFVPNNDAFVAFLSTPGVPDNLSSINPQILEEILKYHLVSGAQLSKSDLSPGDLLPTLQGENIEVNPGLGNPGGAAGTLFTGSLNREIEINGLPLIANNGYLNEVGTILIPPSIGATWAPLLGTNAGTIFLSADFSILAEAVLKADDYASSNGLTTLVDILSGTTMNTVFGPTNVTFNVAGIGVNDLTGEQWYEVILNHVVFSDVAPADLTHGSTWPTATGKDTLYTVVGSAINGLGIFFDSNGDYDYAAPDPTRLEAEIALPDAAINSNGRVYIIAGILLPK